MSPCPHCGADTEPGQLVCVECGGRLALTEEPPEGAPAPRGTPAVLALLLAVVVLGAGGVGYVLAELSDEDDDAPAAERGARPAPSAEPGRPQEATRAETEPDEAARPRRSLLLDWPADLSAHTVVLVTSGDRPAARRVAVEAARSGLEAGLLRSDDFDLGTGLWIVFAGRFDNRASAVRQATNLAERYPGAYAQRVEPAG